MINIITEGNDCHCLRTEGRAFLSHTSMKSLSNKNNMNPLKQNFRNTFIILSLSIATISVQAQSGEETFNKACKACHTVGGGKLVGPDLNGITSKRSEDWLIKWTKSSQTLINNGDADAIAVFEANNKIPMPDQNFSDVEIKGVIDYIKSKSTSGEVTAAAPSATVTPQQTINDPNKASQAEILYGQNLFEGGMRFVNQGPSCISCHNLVSHRVIPGGLLAKDLTTVYSRMGGAAGLTGILNAPPFPAMTQSYKNNPLTEKEISAIIAFLNQEEKESLLEQKIEVTNPLLKWGFIGLIFWICIVLLIWYNRKKDTVKKKIFDRQVRSY